MKIVVAMVALLTASVAVLCSSMSVTIVYSGSVNANRLVDVRDIDGAITFAPHARLEIRATKIARTPERRRLRITTQAMTDGLLVWVSFPVDERGGVERIAEYPTPGAPAQTQASSEPA